MYDKKRNPNKYTNYIIKGEASLAIDDEGSLQTYYGFYPICTVEQITEDNPGYTVGVSRLRTLRQVVYNADGRNPQYDINRGVGLIFTPNDGVIENEPRIIK